MVADNRRYQQRDEDERQTNSAGQSGDIQACRVRPRQILRAWKN
jgi:hypothetical protein